MIQNHSWPETIVQPSKEHGLPDSGVISIQINDSVDSSSVSLPPGKYFTENKSNNEFVTLEKKSVYQDWIFFILLAGFILIAIVQVFQKRRFGMIFRAVYARHYASQLVREGNIFNERISVFLFINYILSLSIFTYFGLYLFSDMTGFYPETIFFIVIAAFFIVYWFVKVVFVRITSIIFTTQNRSSEYLLNNFLINLVNGVVILFLLVPMLYLNGEIFFFAGLIYLIFTFFIKILKGAVIGLSYTKFSSLHLFLYLCTLEILPLIILGKFLYSKLIVI